MCSWCSAAKVVAEGVTAQTLNVVVDLEIVKVGQVNFWVCVLMRESRVVVDCT